MLHLNLKLLLQMHCELYLNKIYPVNLLLLPDFEKVPCSSCQCRQHFFNLPPQKKKIIILRYSSTHFKDRWNFFPPLIKKNIVGGKMLDVISENVKIYQTQIPLKGFINWSFGDKCHLVKDPPISSNTLPNVLISLPSLMFIV